MDLCLNMDILNELLTSLSSLNLPTQKFDDIKEVLLNIGNNHSPRVDNKSTINMLESDREKLVRITHLVKTLKSNNLTWEFLDDDSFIKISIYGSNLLSKQQLYGYMNIPISDGVVRVVKQFDNYKDESLAAHKLLIRDDNEQSINYSCSNWATVSVFVFNLHCRDSLTKALTAKIIFDGHRLNNKQYCPTVLIGVQRKGDESYKGLIDIKEILNAVNDRKFDHYIRVYPFAKCGIDAFIRVTQFERKYRSKNNKINLSFSELDTDDGSTFSDYFKYPRPMPLSKEYINAKRSFCLKTIAKASSSKRLSSITAVSGALSQSDENLMKDPKYSTLSSKPVKKTGVLRKVKSKSHIVMTVTNDGHLFYVKNKCAYKEYNLINCIIMTNDSIAHGLYRNKKDDDCEKGSCSFTLVLKDEKGAGVSREFIANTPEDRNLWIQAINEAKSYLFHRGWISPQLQEILDEPGNGFCAECCAEKPSWLCCDLGIVVCDRCSGSHRKLTHKVSRVCSLLLDNVSEEKLMVLHAFGNRLANSIWENKLPLTNVQKPVPGDLPIEDWLIMKYVDKEFLAPIVTSKQQIQQLLGISIFYRDRETQYLCLCNGTKTEFDRPYSVNDARNPLLIAAFNHDVVTMSMLLWRGVDPNYLDRNGANALTQVIYSDGEHTELLKTILRFYDVPEQQEIQIEIDTSVAVFADNTNLPNNNLPNKDSHICEESIEKFGDSTNEKLKRNDVKLKI